MKYVYYEQLDHIRKYKQENESHSESYQLEI
jgi:hypothetical protein